METPESKRTVLVPTEPVEMVGSAAGQGDPGAGHAKTDYKVLRQGITQGEPTVQPATG